MARPVFRYATLASVKSRIDPDLLTAAAFTDAEILVQIEAASVAINEWTRQLFQPVPEAPRVNGDGRSVTAHPMMLPVLSLKEIRQIENRTTGAYEEMDRIIPGMRNFPEAYQSGYRTIDPLSIRLAEDTSSVAWERGSRTVNMITLLRGFTRGSKNVEMLGWFGWLENLKTITVDLGTTIPANTAAASVIVADIFDADTGDFIEAGDTICIAVQNPTDAIIPTRVEVAIVQSIAGSGPYTLTVDAIHKYPFALPATTTKVYCFGKVPAGICQITEFLATRFVHKRISERTGDTDSLLALAVVDGNLRSERTDNYSYTLGGPAGGDGPAGGGSKIGYYTGSAQMDLLLKQFAQPQAIVKFV